jgi:hypothetical protein
MNPFYVTTNDASPMQSALAVTPNGAADLVPPTGPARPTRAIMVSGAGNVALVMADGTTATLTIPATACGFLLSLAVKRVYATGTTATGIVAFY